MALDYSARRQVSRNRPKRRPIGRYVLLALAGVSVVYGLGFATGWFLFGRPGKLASPTASPSPTAPTTRQATGTATAGPGAPQAGTATPGAGTNLTFFNTLPKGEKSIIGSGINPPHEIRSAPPVHPPAQTAAVERTPPPAQKAEKSEATSGSPEKPKTKAAEANPSAAAEKSSDPRPAAKEKDGYAVQVASYQDRKEAEELKETLEKRGFSVRISETKLQGKGVRYRVKVGKGLHRDGAGQLATKLGGNAMVVSE